MCKADPVWIALNCKIPTSKCVFFSYLNQYAINIFSIFLFIKKSH